MPIPPSPTPPNPDKTVQRPLAAFLDGLALGGLLLVVVLLLSPIAALGLAALQTLLDGVGNPSLRLPEVGRLVMPAVRTVSVVGVAMGLAIPLGAGLAWALTRTRMRRQWFLGSCLLITACTPMYVTTTAWIHLLRGLGLNVISADPNLMVLGAGLILGMGFLPFATGLIALGLASVPQEWEEAALLETNSFGVAWHVTLRGASWSILGASLLGSLWCVGEVVVSDALTLQTYGERIFQAYRIQQNVGSGVLIALPMMAVMILLALGLRPMLLRWSEIPLYHLPRRRKNRRGSGATHCTPRFSIFLSLLCLLACGLMVMPLAHLLYYGYAEAGRLGDLFAFSTRPVITLWDRLGTSGSTALLSALGATLSLLVATPIAWFLVQLRSRPIRWTVWALLLVVLATPGPLLGMGTIRAWNMDGLPGMIFDSPARLVLVYVIRTAPIAILVLWSVFRQTPREVADVLEMDGAYTMEGVMRVVAPAHRGTLSLVWLLLYILCFSEFGAAVIANSPGVPLFSIEFATQIHFSTAYPELARMALLPILFCTLPTSILIRCCLHWFR